MIKYRNPPDRTSSNCGPNCRHASATKMHINLGISRKSSTGGATDKVVQPSAGSVETEGQNILLAPAHNMLTMIGRYN